MNADRPLGARHSRSWFTYPGELVNMWISVCPLNGGSTPTPPLPTQRPPQSMQGVAQADSCLVPPLLYHGIYLASL